MHSDPVTVRLVEAVTADSRCNARRYGKQQYGMRSCPYCTDWYIFRTRNSGSESREIVMEHALDQTFDQPHRRGSRKVHGLT